MKLFLKKVGLFLGILTFSTFAFFLYLKYTHVFPSSEMYYSQEFNQVFKKGDYQLITLGNSKLLSSIEDSILEQELNLKTANLGYSSANISTSKLIMESYLNQCKETPKYLLMEVSWFTFNNKRTTFHPITGDLLLRDLDLWNQIPKYSPEILNHLKKAIFRQFLTKFDLKQATNFDVRFDKKTPNTKDYEFSLEKFERVFPDHRAGIDSFLLADFRSILNIAHKNNMKTILYTAPEGKEYTAHQQDRKKIKNIFKSIAKEDANTTYLDYSATGDLWKDKYELWLRNSHHINEKALFTHELAQDIKFAMN